MMQSVGPYQLIEVMGTCPVGRVWSAVESSGRSLSIAVLDSAVAGDPQWRQAFAAAANSVGEPWAEGSAIVDADLGAPVPWVACPAGGGAGAERVFVALGLDYRSGGSDAAAPDPSPVESPASADGAPEQAFPWPPPGVSSPPDAGSPQQAPLTPPPAFGPGEPGWVGPTAPVDPISFDPSTSPVRRVVPSEPRPRRTRLWVAIGAALALLVAGGGAVVAWQRSGGESARPPASTSSALAPAPSAAPPRQPGLEPPKPGTWPAAWPRFQPTDRVRTLTGLDGLGFPLKVPPAWQCTPDGRAQGYARYRCGVSATGTGNTVVEITVRDCPQPCDQQRQTAMRTAEEAWGLQWVRTGEYSTYTERAGLQVDGQRSYALVVVAYWRGGEDGTIDRQIVLRMHAPVDQTNMLRRLTNYLRDTLIF